MYVLSLEGNKTWNYICDPDYYSSSSRFVVTLGLVCLVSDHRDFGIQSTVVRLPQEQDDGDRAQPHGAGRRVSRSEAHSTRR